ncbi:MAG: transposase [Methylococcales bacterium]|nr:transposase [Methylococcales bacterium]
MDGHIGYEKPSPDGYNTGHSRHGYHRKTLKGEPGAIEIETPRACNGSFEPVFVAKNQTRLTRFDDQILLLNPLLTISEALNFLLCAIKRPSYKSFVRLAFPIAGIQRRTFRRQWS